MTERKYAKAVMDPGGIMTAEEYYERCPDMTGRLMTKDNIETAMRLDDEYQGGANFLFRDSDGKLMLFAAHPKEAIAGGTPGITLDDGTSFPGLEPGEYVGLCSFLSCVDMMRLGLFPNIIRRYANAQEYLSQGHLQA